MTSDSAPLTVLFVAGWGRSGSTILGNLLGEAHGAVSVGELNNYWAMRASLRRACGCGLPHDACPFWQEVGSNLKDPRNADPAYVLPIRARELAFWPALATSIVPRGRGRARAKLQYPEILADLYQAVGRVTGAGVIVDVSKYPVDGLMAALAPGIKPAIVQMVRDPRASAWSWLRPKQAIPGEAVFMTRHGGVDSSWKWLTHNVAAEVFARTVPGVKYRALRYEDFAASPRAVAADVAEWAGIDASTLPFTSDTTLRLSANHTAMGNPNRYEIGDVEVRPDVAWRRDMPLVAKLLATAPALPLLHRYRYPVFPR